MGIIMNDKLIIIGIGEIANIAYEYFSEDSMYDIKGFAVNSQYKKVDVFRGLPVFDVEKLKNIYSPKECKIFVAMGNGKLNYERTSMFYRIKEQGYTFANYISSNAFIWKNVSIGENCFILENNVLQPFVSIGDNVFIWSGNHIGHQTHIANNCFITSHVVISGMCNIGENTFIGVNSSVSEYINIAKDNYIAMATVINKNTKENSIYKGNPAQTFDVTAKEYCEV